MKILMLVFMERHLLGATWPSPKPFRDKLPPNGFGDGLIKDQI